MKFNYIVVTLKIESYLDGGVKFKLKTDNIIPFISKELAQQYMDELKEVDINAILININELP